jgi:arylsulfatase A-like enzyme
LSRGNPLFADVYDFYWPASDVVDKACERIDAIRQAPFFFFVHFMDPHDPYMLHPLENKRGYARLAWGELSEEQLGPVHQAYNREIEYTDSHLGRLFAHLKDQGLYDELAIILTADHGEEFLEHGGWWHGRTLYDEQLRVPLIVKLPNQEFAGQSKPYQVRLLDIAPTICRIMGMEPPRHMQGVPLLQDGRPVDPELSMVFSEEDFEGNVLQSARGLEWKMHRSNPENPRGLPPLMLFHLATDSGEQRNVQDENAKQAADMAYWAKLSKDRALMESGSLPEE